MFIYQAAEICSGILTWCLGIAFRPITRITTGFFFAAFAMGYAAIIQHLIYSSPPCYDSPMTCPASKDGKLPNHIHVAIQTPAYLLIGLSEIFASITGLEYAFTKAPPSMKSFVTAMFLLTSAFGAALGMAISPTAKNPKLVVSIHISIPFVFLCFVRN